MEVPVKKVGMRSGDMQRVVDSHALYQLINGAAVSSLNPSTLRNPECLAAYVDLRETMLKL